MNLFEINKQIEITVENNIDKETGELTDNTLKLIDDLQITEEEKIENIGLFIKNLTAFEEALTTEIDNLSKRKKTVNNKIFFLKTYLSNYLQFINKDKFETARLKLAFRKSESVEISDKFDNRDYLRIKTEIDKIKLKNDLKQGIKIDGAFILEKRNLIIR